MLALRTLALRTQLNSFWRTLAIVCLVLGGCVPSGQPGFEFVDADVPEVSEVRRAGEAAAQQLVAALLPVVKGAMEEGGPTKAVEVCHTKAMPLTESALAGLPAVTAVKRTSLRVRNPDNAPDAAELSALQHVKKLVDSGEAAPPLLVQRIGAADAPEEWRVYRPLVVLPLCVTCHGEVESMPESLQNVLAERYPHDEATGYKEGDWRGLIRVSVAAEKL